MIGLDVYPLHPIAQHVGWALVHFIWQGFAVALLLAVALRLMKHHAPRARYVPAFAALLLLLALPVATLVRLEWSHMAPARSVAEAQPKESVASSSDAPFVGSERGATHQGIRSDLSRPGHHSWLEALLLRSLQMALGKIGVIIQSIAPAIVLGWLIGVVVLLIRLAGGALLLRRWCGPLSRTVPARWLEPANKLAAQLGLRPRIRTATNLAVPMVVDFWRPTLLVPAGRFLSDSGEAEEAILAHEMAHLARRDALGQLAQILAETLLFFHPATWWISRRVHVEREQSCDDLAAELQGDRASYARGLAELEKSRQMAPRLALAGSRGPLQRRIARLLSEPTPKSHRSLLGFAGSVGLTSLVVLTLAAFVCEMPRASGPYPTTADEYEKQVRTALSNGDDGLALELACHKPSGWVGGDWNTDRELALEIDAAMHRRYNGAFEPPKDIEQLLPFKWDSVGRSFGFGPYAEINDYDSAREIPRDHHLVIEKGEGHFLLTVDLDLDGRPELAYDGNDAEIASGIDYVVDRDRDGRRAQWLIPVGRSDPREQAQVMLYRDGEFFIVLVDFNGDGIGDCGRSNSTVWQPPCNVHGAPESSESKGAAPTPPKEEPHVDQPRQITEQDAEIANEWAAYQASVQKALEAGDDAAAAELLCPMPIVSLKQMDLQFFYDINTLISRRYNEVFQPPENSAHLQFGGSFSTTGNYDGVDSYSIEDDAANEGEGQQPDSARGKSFTTGMCFAPHSALNDPNPPAYLRVIPGEDPMITVDLDLDGVPEMTFDGEQADFASGLAVVSDRADDGRRFQWLAAKAGTDPHEQAQIWFYRDNGKLWISVDTDADGRTNCEWGGCIR